MTSLRPYQLLAVGMAREHLRDRPILRLDTGAGKTVIAAEIMRLADAKSRRTIFLCDRREIVKQTCARLNDAGVRAGAIQAGLPATDAPHQVAAVQTLHARAKRGTPPPPADLAFADECRLAMAPTYRGVLEQYPTRIGLDATPVRLDGKGLGALFGIILEPTTTAELRAGGWLAPYRLWSAPFDPRSLKMRGGEFTDESAANAMMERHVVGDVVQTYARHRGPFLLFACTVRHSIAMRDALRAAGFRAEHLDAKSPDRDDVLDTLRSRAIDVLCNVGLFGYGTDVPDLDGVILARPTASLALYRQQVGRALRPKPGGRPAIILDHGGNFLRHGLPDLPVRWSLSDRETRLDLEIGEVAAALCSRCGEALPRGTSACPACSAGRDGSGTVVRVVSHAGELVEVGQEHPPVPPASREQKRERFRELVAIAHRRGYRKGWCGRAYREEFGVWPVGMADLVDAELRRCVDPGSCAFCDGVFVTREEFAW